MILAIETSTTEASLALVERHEGEVLWQASFESDRLHNAKIFDPVAEALDIGRGKLERMIVGLGPGSYSGIRVGIAVANGLALALDVPVAGLASIAVLSGEAEFIVTGDARRSSFYLAHILNRRLEKEPQIMGKGQWLDELATLRHKGLSIYTTEKPLAAEVGIELRCPEATELAREASAMESSEWSKLADQPLQPVYLRAPYITQAK
jgi:tRNA threonylcarbamoyl adenosine modification protein YeaZ